MGFYTTMSGPNIARHRWAQKGTSGVLRQRRGGITLGLGHLTCRTPSAGSDGLGWGGLEFGRRGVIFRAGGGTGLVDDCVTRQVHEWDDGGVGVSSPSGTVLAWREALAFCRAHRNVHGEAYDAYDAAAIEASHGDPQQALELLDFSIDTCHRAGDRSNLAAALASRAVTFDEIFCNRKRRPRSTVPAATVRASSSWSDFSRPWNVSLSALGQEVFDDCVAYGAGMEAGDAVADALQQIRLARQVRRAK